jgi:hypothetical protein
LCDSSPRIAEDSKPLKARKREEHAKPAGTIVVTDWNKTPGRPIAFGRSIDDGADEGDDSIDIKLLHY